MSKLNAIYFATRSAIHMSDQALAAPVDFIERFEDLSNAVVADLLEAANLALWAERIEAEGNDIKAASVRQEARAYHAQAMRQTQAIGAIMARAERAEGDRLAA